MSQSSSRAWPRPPDCPCCRPASRAWGRRASSVLRLQGQQILLLRGQRLRDCRSSAADRPCFTCLPVKSTKTWSIQPSSLLCTLAILVSSSVTRAAARTVLLDALVLRRAVLHADQLLLLGRDLHGARGQSGWRCLVPRLLARHTPAPASYCNRARCPACPTCTRGASDRPSREPPLVLRRRRRRSCHTSGRSHSRPRNASATSIRSKNLLHNITSRVDLRPVISSSRASARWKLHHFFVVHQLVIHHIHEIRKARDRKSSVPV